MYDIQKSKSQSGLKFSEENEMKRALSKTDVSNEESPKQEQKKDLLGAVKEKVTTGINKVKDNLTLKKNKKDSESKKSEKSDRKSVESNNTPDKEAKPKDNIDAKPSYQEIMEQRRQENKEKMERMKMSKKLDEVFGVLRSESVDDIKKTEITVRGMGNINLNRQKQKKSEVEHNKMDEYEQKRTTRQQIAMPEKPATFKKPKKSIPKEETPPKPTPAVEPPSKPDETPKPKKKSNFVFITKVPTPPKEPTPPPPKSPTPVKEKTPDLETKFWPTPKLPTPVPLQMEAEEEDLIQLEPTKPLKIGINGFDRIGRLAFRTALESGLNVTAINDPFIPLHYMIYSLKFDMAHAKTRKKEMKVVETPNGQLIVNDKHVSVFKEVDPRKIPWNSAGVNYVIEATESLQSKVNAMHHLENDTAGIAMEDLINKKEMNGGISESKPAIPLSERTVKKVVVASNSTEFPSFGIGINDERLSRASNVICSISPQANALVLPLKIIQQAFGVRFCSYTFLKAVMGPTKDIKCPTLGPASHRKNIKWDFSENLVPAPCPSLEEEAIRYLPSM